MRAHKSETQFLPRTHKKKSQKMKLCLHTHNQNPQELEKAVDSWSLVPLTSTPQICVLVVCLADLRWAVATSCSILIIYS